MSKFISQVDILIHNNKYSDIKINLQNLTNTYKLLFEFENITNFDTILISKLFYISAIVIADANTNLKSDSYSNINQTKYIFSKYMYLKVKI